MDAFCRLSGLDPLWVSGLQWPRSHMTELCVSFSANNSSCKHMSSSGTKSVNFLLLQHTMPIWWRTIDVLNSYCTVFVFVHIVLRIDITRLGLIATAYVRLCFICFKLSSGTWQSRRFTQACCLVSNTIWSIQNDNMKNSKCAFVCGGERVHQKCQLAAVSSMGKHYGATLTSSVCSPPACEKCWMGEFLLDR